MTFDDINYQFKHGEHSVELQPLSFQLLKTLAERPGEIVSPQELFQAIWGDVALSQETLKQRVFITRRALQDGGITAVEIQTVRGQGYRLIAPKEESATTANKRPGSLVILAFPLLLGLSALIYLFWPVPEIPINNRVVIWQETTDVEGAERFVHLLRSALLTSSNAGRLQLIQSTRDTEQAIPRQARADRAALITRVSFMAEDMGGLATIEIIEPHTATVLRSESFTLASEAPDFSEHVSAIERLIASGLLILDRDIRNNASHPRWRELKQLANPS